jgi:hypothetical protein
MIRRERLPVQLPRREEPLGRALLQGPYSAKLRSGMIFVDEHGLRLDGLTFGWDAFASWEVEPSDEHRAWVREHWSSELGQCYDACIRLDTKCGVMIGRRGSMGRILIAATSARRAEAYLALSPIRQAVSL